MDDRKAIQLPVFYNKGGKKIKALGSLP